MIFTLTDPLFVAATGGLFDFLHTMKGPDFLGLFFGWFVAIFVGVMVLRRTGRDTPGVSRAGFLLFESLGILRIAVGSAHGLHNWGFLIFMMIAGGLCFILRSKYFEGTGGGGGDTGGGDTGGTWWSTDSDGSSSSGGGGCGGGGSGCGGCGGGGD